MNQQYGGFTAPQPINTQPGAGAPGQIPAAPTPNFQPPGQPNAPIPNQTNPVIGPAGATPVVPGQPAPIAPVPGPAPNADPLIDYKQRFSDSQKQITKLQEEKRATIATVEELSSKLDSYKGRMGQIRAELTKQEQIFNNQGYSDTDRNVALKLWERLESQYGELHKNAEVTSQNLQQSQQYTQQQQAEYTQRWNMKMATIENETLHLIEDPQLVAEYGSPLNVYNLMTQHVMPATANDPLAKFVFNEYIFGRATLKDVANAALEPQRKILSTIYKKQTNNVSAAPGFQPQAPQQYQAPRANGVFS